MDNPEPVGMLQWIRKGLRFREALNQRPPTVEIGEACKALLDHRQMTGGGEVPMPAGTWTLNETLYIGSDISLIGRGSPDCVVKAGAHLDYMIQVPAVAENIRFERLYFIGNGDSTCVKADM